MHLKLYTDLGLRVLMVVARLRPDERMTLPELAARLNCSQNHVTKVANYMVRLGWLTTVRGRNGGMQLAMPADQYRIGDVVRTLEGSDPLIDCSDPPCPFCGRALPVWAAPEAYAHGLWVKCKNPACKREVEIKL